MIIQDNILIFLDRFFIFVLIQGHVTFTLQVFLHWQTNFCLLQGDDRQSRVGLIFSIV